VCVGCKGTGPLFLTRKAASVHNFRSASCKGKGIKCITIETRPGDREVGGSGAAGPVPDLRHQPPGTVPYLQPRQG
jgi:hypothetical protein